MEYLEKSYPDVDQGVLLDEAGITRFEINDHSHWFSQEQVDRFQDAVVRLTGNPGIARDAGRYAVSAEAFGRLKQLLLGLLSLETIYLLMEKNYAVVSRGATIKARKLGPRRIEITATPPPGVDEKPYQCQNRTGTFESLAKLFTKNYAHIEHPDCFHRGDESCRYVITWEKETSLLWKRLLYISIMLNIIGSAALFFFLATPVWATVSFCGFLISLVIFIGYAHIERESLTEIIKNQGDVSRALVEEMETRYDYVTFVQELGQATSTVSDVKRLLKTVADIMAKYLRFDRGLFLLPDEEGTHLSYAAGFGCTGKVEEKLGKTALRLADDNPRGEFVRVFHQNSPLFFKERGELAHGPHQADVELVNALDVKSVLCLPIVYEEESLGIMVMGHLRAQAHPTQTEINLLRSVSSQVALKMKESESFYRLQQSEEKYRQLYRKSRQEEEVYRSLLESSADAITIYDMEGRATYVSPVFTEIFGWTLEEVKGRRIPFVPESERESTMLGIKRIMEEGKGIQGFRTRRLTKDGRIIHVSISGSRFDDHEGKPAGMLVILRDISERTKDEQELQMAKQRAEAASRAKSDFLANMSHELRTPLNHIMGFTELVLDRDLGELNEKQEEYLGDVHKSSEHLLALINDILDLSKIEAGRMELEPSEVDLKALLEGSLMMVKEKAMGHGIALTIDADGIPDTLIGDERKLKQILYNLLSNAVKFTPEGGQIHITARQVHHPAGEGDEREEPPSGEWVQVSVVDSGIGIKQDDLERIFGHFEQAEGSLNRVYQGTGLGLSLAKNLVELHGGRIWAESEGEGKGSTFHFVVPQQVPLEVGEGP